MYGIFGVCILCVNFVCNFVVHVCYIERKMLMFQVLEEAQKMAVEKYGVEDKTNLYIGSYHDFAINSHH